MNILLFIATVVLSKVIGSQMGFTYNLFSDPFSLKLALIDFSLFVVAGITLHFVYEKGRNLIKGSGKN